MLAVRAELERVESLHAELLVKRAVKSAGTPEQLHLLRAALRERPSNPRALELLEALAPADFPAGDARFWLDWHLDVERRGATLSHEPSGDLRRLAPGWAGALTRSRRAPSAS